MSIKLVLVSRVKNEIDIVEAFVRHHAAHFDHLLIEDDGSEDGTYELLCALRDEGLPLALERATFVGNRQVERTTCLARLAVNRHAADWVFPLDADEFIEPAQGQSLRDLFAQRAPALHCVGWSGFLWTRENEADDRNPVLRLTQRLPPRTDMTKVIIPSVLVAADDFCLAPGNHYVVRNGVFDLGTRLVGVELCHFPVRSRSQYEVKVVRGYLQWRGSPSFLAGMGFQYDEPFALLKAGAESLVALMEADARRYSVEPHVEIDTTARYAPLRYAGGQLSQVQPPIALQSFLPAFAEQMALRIGAQAARIAALEAELVAAKRLLMTASPAAEA